MAPQCEADDIEYQINLIRKMRKKQAHSNTSILSSTRKRQSIQYCSAFTAATGGQKGEV